MRLVPLVLLSVVACGVTACAGGPPSRYSDSQIDRALSSAPYAAQPSLIVAREIAFARAAREEGQWTAFAEFAADDAILHGRNGPVPAKRLLAGLSDPAEAVQWSPRTVMMSCDGRVAVSRGRFRDPEGNIGSFVTVWNRSGYDDEYRWVYDAGGNDVPQPTPVEPAENEIIATAYDYVQGLVADCPRGGESVPPRCAGSGNIVSTAASISARIILPLAPGKRSWRSGLLHPNDYPPLALSRRP